MSSPVSGSVDFAGSPLLLGLMEEEAEALFALADRRTYKAGDLIVREGDPSDCLYILASGNLEVMRLSEGNPVILATLTKAGSFFGEMSLVDIMPRSADVRAKSNAEILAFPKGELAAFFTQSPRAQMTMILNIARNLSLRLRDADARIVELSRDLARAG